MGSARTSASTESLSTIPATQRASPNWSRQGLGWLLVGGVLYTVTAKGNATINSQTTATLRGMGRTRNVGTPRPRRTRLDTTPIARMATDRVANAPSTKRPTSPSKNVESGARRNMIPKYTQIEVAGTTTHSGTTLCNRLSALCGPCEPDSLISLLEPSSKYLYGAVSRLISPTPTDTAMLQVVGGLARAPFVQLSSLA